jgi:ABC-type branched-subunit amino acid transport system ATPase component
MSASFRQFSPALATILLAEQHLDFRREFAEHIGMMDGGEIAHGGPAVAPDMRGCLTV